MVRPPRVFGARGRDPTSAGAPRPSPSLRQQGFAASPPTRARVRLLGPCFKTGRVGHRHRRRPLAGPFLPTAPREGRSERRGPSRHGGAARSGRTEDSPPQLDSRVGSGGPRPPSPKRDPASPAGPPRRGRRGARGGGAVPEEGAEAIVFLGPGRRRPLLPRGGCNAGPPRPAGVRPAGRLGPATFRPRGLPGRPGAGRGAPPRRKCALRGPEPSGPRPPRPQTGGPPARGAAGRARESAETRAGRPPESRRVESSGRTARTPPVYLLTVSRPLELSLQSSFHLSLTVLVRYRSRAGI